VRLTGTPDELQPVWSDYGIFVQQEPLGDSAQSRTATHTACVLAVDAEGRFRVTYSCGTPHEDILQDVEHLVL